jgi:DNA-binding MarR family transcriptional regulator
VATDQQLLALWRNIHHVNAAIRAALSERLDAEGSCSLLEHDLMSWLEVDGRARPRMLDLAELLGMTQGGVTRLVDRLIGRGWVMREQPPGNRRVMHARLTDEGVKALATTRKAYFSALREILTERLADPQIATLTELTAGFLSGPGMHQPRAQADEH